MSDELITLAEAETITGIGQETLKKQIKSGKITSAVMKGKTWLVPKSDLQPKIPRAIFSGLLTIGGGELPCYVLEGGVRVFSTIGLLQSLGFKTNVNADEVFKSKQIQPFLPSSADRRKRGNLIDFYTDKGQLARGYDVEKFIEICQAYSQALEAGILTLPRHVEAANKANAILRACSKIGVIALVDEVTGYQYARAENELQFKLKLYLSEEMRGWEKTFPDDLWLQLARLTHWSGSPTKNRPRHWGYFVMELIYRSLDPDVAKYLKDNKPEPKKGQNYHQWFNEDYGVKKLREHINRIIGMAQAADSIDELKKKIAFYYGREPLQLELFLEKSIPMDEKV
jgi:hypothetical protein